MRLLIFVLPLLICIFNLSNAQITYGRCFTPDEYRGNCIKFPECQSLFELSQKKPPNNQDRLFITLSQCGFRDGKPLVCCRDAPSAPPPTQPSPVQPPPTQPSPVNPPSNQAQYLLPRPGVCGIDTENRIYGGNKTFIDEYPWTVLLGYSKPAGKFGFHCGGVLISDQYVLTASHCVNGKDLPQTWTLSHVRVGEWDLSQQQDCDDSFTNEVVCSNGSEMDVEINEKIPHPQYDPFGTNQHNDIALLRLGQKVQFNDYIKPICLPSEPTLRSNDFVKQTLAVAGWGKTEKVSQSNIKLKVNVNGVSNADCNKVYNTEQRQIVDSQVCAGGKKGEDSCRGDSGGPLMRQNEKATPPYWYLAGVVSYGPSPCGMEGWPGVYTRVASYVPWIEQQLKP